MLKKFGVIMVVTFALLSWWLVDRHEKRELQAYQVGHMIREFNSLRLLLNPMQANEVPRSLTEALARAKKAPGSDGLDWTMWQSGRDVWGGPIIYEVSRDMSYVTLRSYGQNGKDDGGHGDDIIQVIPRP